MSTTDDRETREDLGTDAEAPTAPRKSLFRVGPLQVLTFVGLCLALGLLVGSKYPWLFPH